MAKKMEMETFLSTLAKSLEPYYLPPATPGGYDINHIHEMLRLGPQIKALTRYLDLDLDEYTAAVLLHNSDRPDELKKMLKVGEVGWKENWRQYLLSFFPGGPFNEPAVGRIVRAVLEHSKKDDELEDSVLLTALRIADKVVRLGPLGMMGQPANRGSYQMFYDPVDPFVYGSTEEDKLRAVWNDYFRVLEWIPMLLQRALTANELRTLVDKNDIREEVHYIRGVGRMIARVTGAENSVEECLQKALGRTYDEFPPMKLSSKSRWW